ncbi:MAG: tetratricopeptide repeat protein [Thermogutta sp.]
MNACERLKQATLTIAVLAAIAVVSGWTVRSEELLQATVRYNAAARLHNLQSWDLAASEWEGFIRDFPNDPRIGRAYHYLGVCFYNQQKYGEAAEAFRQSLTKELEAELAELSLLYQGISLFDAAQNGKAELYAEARSACEKYLKTYPKGKHAGEAAFYAAECLYYQGQKEEAARSYRQFLQQFRDHQRTPDVFLALATCEEELGNRQAALNDYQMFLRQYAQHPRAMEAQYRLGEVLYALGNFAEAELAFRKAGGDSRFVDADLAVIRTGDSLVQLKRFDEAAQQYASVEKRFPQSSRIAQAILAAGRCYYLAANYDSALPFLTRAAQAQETQGEALHWLARCYLKKNLPEQVIATVQKPLADAAPPPWGARLTLDRADALYQIPHRQAEAIQEYARAAELARQNNDTDLMGDALYAAAYAALALKQIGEARKYASMFQSLCGNHALAADIVQILAECELADGNYDRAYQTYEKLLQQFRSHPQANIWRLRQIMALQLDGKHGDVIKRVEAILPQLQDKAAQGTAYTLMGASQLELGQLKPAEESLLLALSRSPQEEKAMLLLASAYFRQGRAQDARATAEKLIKDFPKSAIIDRAYYRLGEYCFALGDWAAAEAAYRHVINNFPQSPLLPAATHELACTLIKANRLSEAEKVLLGLLDQYPKDPVTPRSRYVLGVLYSQTNQVDRAVQMITEAIHGGLEGAERATALYTLGMISISLKEYDRAIEVFSQILKDNPQFADADKVIYQWAWALKLAGKEDEALKLFAQLVEQYPSSAFKTEAEYHLGGKFYNEQDFLRAAQYYHSAFQQAQNADLKEKAVHRLGWCYFKLGQYDRAYQTFAYQRANFAKGPLFSDGAFMEAESLFHLEKYAEALSAYERLPELETENFELLRLLHAGQAASRLKQFDKALAFLNRCLTKFPTAPELPQIKFEIGYVYYQREEFGQAMEHLQEVVLKSTDETAARAQFTIGEIQFKQKDYENAVKSFFRVAYGFNSPTWQAAALFESARCFEMLKKPEQAARMYRELIEKFPQSTQIVEAKAKLQVLEK